MSRIGVLALQGAFELHRPHLEASGAEYIEVTRVADFDGIDGLILPGGESAVMLKLIDLLGIRSALEDSLARKPSWGICAGAILLARKVLSPEQFSFGTVDVEIKRNAYGRQLESTEEMVAGYRVSYIRAPRISQVGTEVEVMTQRDGHATWVKSGLSSATTFHPETNLNFPSPWHQEFVRLCGQSSAT